MASQSTDLARVTTEVRRCFWLLAVVSDEMIADLGLTASLRAVLEHLDAFGPQTVPQIAREKAVKRQSIQALVDRLLELGFVSTKDNPTHRRSVLIGLTPSGKAVFRKVGQREARVLAELGSRLDGRGLATTARTLAELRSALQQLNQGKHSDDDHDD